MESLLPLLMHYQNVGSHRDLPDVFLEIRPHNEPILFRSNEKSLIQITHNDFDLASEQIIVRDIIFKGHCGYLDDRTTIRIFLCLNSYELSFKEYDLVVEKALINHVNIQKNVYAMIADGKIERAISTLRQYASKLDEKVQRNIIQISARWNIYNERLVQGKSADIAERNDIISSLSEIVYSLSSFIEEQVDDN
jgi:hypothetical protein